MNFVDDPFQVDATELTGLSVELTRRCLLRVTGPDAIRFLNGQVSCDVTGPLEDRAAAGCLCTIRGKVEALVWISADSEGVRIDGQSSQRDFLMERLDRYLIADDCEIEDVTGRFRLIHHFDPNGTGVDSRRCRISGKDRWVPADQPSPQQNDAETMDEDDFEILQLASGLPAAPTEIDGDSFPAELGLDNFAVDFRKGCYLGQEVISRIKSVGRVKRACSLIRGKEAWDRESAVRKENGDLGRATRASIETSKGVFVGFAWFPTKGDLAQPVAVQEVAFPLND